MTSDWQREKRARGWPVAIDPAGCGCTECITGQYVPLDQATAAQVYAMLKGQLRNNLNAGDLAVRVTLDVASWARLGYGVQDDVEELLNLEFEGGGYHAGGR